MINILITGADGQLGSELKHLASFDCNNTFFFTDFSQLDICNHIYVKQFIIKKNINAIINCAAYTAVDRAEEQFQLSNKINNLAVKNLAIISKELNIKLIHISTDYVFDGTNNLPYQETDKPNPQTVYGNTKLAGENAIKKINPKKTIIIRTSWVYSNYGNNFMKTMINLSKDKNEIRVISDQVGTPTYARDLAKTILEILPKLNNVNTEIFHFSNEGICSWYDFAKAIFEIRNINVKLLPIKSVEYPTLAKRPYYSVLNKNKIKNKFEIEIQNWRNALEDCLK